MQVGIIGAGTMGSGIAQVAATAGCEVILFDLNHDQLERSQAALEKVMNRLVEKKRVTSDESTAIQSRIQYKDSLRALQPMDLVIEAIVEKLEVKQQVFQELEKYVSDDCIIASNTSSLSLASIASALQQPGRCIGIHFFNPAPLMKLVEVIPAVQTQDAVTEKVVATIKDWGKTVAVAKDTPGFIVNRVARPFYGEALQIFEEGLADFATIDAAMKEKGGFRMGPFELMDFIGNDVNYAVTESVFQAFYNDPRYKPSFTQQRYAQAGWLGRKSGRGYYHYDDAFAKANKQQPDTNQTAEELDELKTYIFERIRIMLINEAADALFWNVSTAEGIDDAMTKGVNYPKGLLAWANEIGIDTCVDQMDALYDRYRSDRYRCSPILNDLAENDLEFDV